MIYEAQIIFFSEICYQFHILRLVRYEINNRFLKEILHNAFAEMPIKTILFKIIFKYYQINNIKIKNVILPSEWQYITSACSLDAAFAFSIVPHNTKLCREQYNSLTLNYNPKTIIISTFGIKLFVSKWSYQWSQSQKSILKHCYNSYGISYIYTLYVSHLKKTSDYLSQLSQLSLKQLFQMELYYEGDIFWWLQIFFRTNF